MTVRFLVLGGELRRAQQKALRFFQFFKPIKPDLGLNSALAVVNGAVTDATVEKSPTMAVYTEQQPTWPWVPLLVLVSLGQGEPRKGKTLWNSDFPARLRLARLGTGHPLLQNQLFKKMQKKVAKAQAYAAHCLPICLFLS